MTLVRFGHSPDADDAYMFFGLAHGLVKTEGFTVTHLLEEIEKLNHRALSADLEVTAVSAHAFAMVSARYAPMKTGASVARGYGPRLVTLHADAELADIEGWRIAVPGKLTTAFLLGKILLPTFEPLFLPFRDVEGALHRGDADAAILIHEGQIQWRERGFTLLADLGQAFYNETGLPVPLGLDVVRRDLGATMCNRLQTALRESILCAHSRRREAIEYALQFASGLDYDTADRFIGMYVNDDTLDLPSDALEGLKELYSRAVRLGALQEMPRLDFVG